MKNAKKSKFAQFGGNAPREPYRVFETEQEFRDAVEEELAARSGGCEDYESDEEYETDDYDELSEQWRRDARELMRIVPDFDFASALRNEVFKNKLMQGSTVFEAYAEMIKPPARPRREPIAQNAQSARRGTGAATRNPASMSDDEFKRYIEAIRRG